jgi:YtkA-like
VSSQFTRQCASVISIRHLVLMAVASLSAVLAVSLSACSGANPRSGAPTFGAAPYLSASGGQLLIEMRTFPQPPERGTVAVQYTVTDTADGSLRDGLVIAVEPWMPYDNHGTSIVPTVTAEGQGKYLVENVDLFMGGRWELRTAVSGPVGQNVSLAFDLP